MTTENNLIEKIEHFGGVKTLPNILSAKILFLRETVLYLFIEDIFFCNLFY